MSGDAPELLLAHHLKALKLPTFLREHHKLETRIHLARLVIS